MSVICAYAERRHQERWMRAPQAPTLNEIGTSGAHRLVPVADVGAGVRTRVNDVGGNRHR